MVCPRLLWKGFILQLSLGPLGLMCPETSICKRRAPLLLGKAACILLHTAVIPRVQVGLKAAS